VSSLLQLTLLIESFHELFKTYIIFEIHRSHKWVRERRRNIPGTLNLLILAVARTCLAIEASDRSVEFVALGLVQRLVVVGVCSVESVLSSLSPGITSRAILIGNLSVHVECLLVRRGLLIPVLLDGPVGSCRKRNASIASGTIVIEFLKTRHVADGVHGLDIGPLVVVTVPDAPGRCNTRDEASIHVSASRDGGESCVINVETRDQVDIGYLSAFIVSVDAIRLFVAVIGDMGSDFGGDSSFGSSQH